MLSELLANFYHYNMSMNMRKAKELFLDRLQLDYQKRMFCENHGDALASISENVGACYDEM